MVLVEWMMESAQEELARRTEMYAKYGRLTVTHDGNGTFLQFDDQADNDVRLGESDLIEQVADQVHRFNLGYGVDMKDWPDVLQQEALKIMTERRKDLPVRVSDVT